MKTKLLAFFSQLSALTQNELENYSAKDVILRKTLSGWKPTRTDNFFHLFLGSKQAMELTLDLQDNQGIFHRENTCMLDDKVCFLT